MSAQSLQQVQKQTQILALAPQLRQSLKILQAPTLDLRHAILEELQTNPVLEELPMRGVSLEEKSSPAADASDDMAGQEMEFKENYQILNELREDWREDMAEEAGQKGYTKDDAEKRRHFFDSYTTESSMQERLMRQARMTDTTPETLRAFEYLIGSLDDRGFLPTPLPDLAQMSGLPLKSIQDACQLLKSLEPPGLGSANLRECLLTQLQLRGRDHRLAAIIVRDHFEALLHRRLPQIARALELKLEDVQKALQEIASLDPAPGRKFGEDSNRIIIPDVKVEKDGDNWVIILNNEYLPRLRLNQSYKDLIAKGLISPQEKSYILDKIRSGKFLINSLEQRQQTIERIARQILKFQHDFFEEGVARLHPLRMQEIARELGIHETTVSRAIANKYMETPHGIFEFKYFFTSGYQSSDGAAVANTSIKERIAHFVAMESPSKPYSDQEIVEMLAEENIKIARRTVAKYRDELGLLPTNLRRRYN